MRMVQNLLITMMLYLACFVGEGFCTTLKTFAFEGLCGTAQTIVHVRCLEKKGIWEDGTLSQTGRRGVYTEFRFAVVEAVKGNLGREFVLILPGGEAEGHHTQVVGMPQFVVGQEMVLFLSEPDAHGSPWPVGLEQGCYGISVDDKGQRQVVLTKRNPLDPSLRAKPALKNTIALADFMDSIRQTMHLESPPKNDTHE